MNEVRCFKHARGLRLDEQSPRTGGIPNSRNRARCRPRQPGVDGCSRHSLPRKACRDGKRSTRNLGLAEYNDPREKREDPAYTLCINPSKTHICILTTHQCVSILPQSKPTPRRKLLIRRKLSH